MAALREHEDAVMTMTMMIGWPLCDDDHYYLLRSIRGHLCVLLVVVVEINVSILLLLSLSYHTAYVLALVTVIATMMMMFEVDDNDGCLT